MPKKTTACHAREKPQATPVGMWDSAAFHGTPQRFPAASFCALMRSQLGQLAAQEAEHASELQGSEGGESARSASSDKTSSPASSPVRASLFKKSKAGAPSAWLAAEKKLKRVRASARRYVARKRASRQGAIEAARSVVGAALEIFDESEQRWEHTKVLECDVTWFENGTACRITHQIVPVDDLDRAVGPTRWLDIAKVRSYVSVRVEPDPESRALWEANERKAAMQEKGVELARQQTVERRLEREAKEQSDERRFATVRKDAVDRKRDNAYAEASTMLKTKAVKVVTKTIAKSVVQELRAGLSDAKNLRPTNHSQLQALEKEAAKKAKYACDEEEERQRHHLDEVLTAEHDDDDSSEDLSCPPFERAPSVQRRQLLSVVTKHGLKAHRRGSNEKRFLSNVVTASSLALRSISRGSSQRKGTHCTPTSFAVFFFLSSSSSSSSFKRKTRR